MQAGTLRHWVILQQPGGARDAVGERVTTWTDVATVPASVVSVSGRELFLAGQQMGAAVLLVTVRWMSELAALDASWRIKFGTRILVLAAPPRNVDEANISLELTCIEGLAQE